MLTTVRSLIGILRNVFVVLEQKNKQLKPLKGEENEFYEGVNISIFSVHNYNLIAVKDVVTEEEENLKPPENGYCTC